MTTGARAELMAYTQAHAGHAGNRMADFVSAYFESADPDEILAEIEASAAKRTGAAGATGGS